MSGDADRVRNLLIKERAKTAALLVARYTGRNSANMMKKETSQSAAKKLSMKVLGTEIVHIKVGALLQDYGIHKSLICGASRYFRAAFTCGLEESKSLTLTLDSVEPATFALFYGWLYSRTIWDETSEDAKPQPMTLAKLYVFANMAYLTALKNATLRLLYEVTMDAKDNDGFVAVDPELMAYVWGNASATSALRRLMCDICVYKVRWNGASVSATVAGLDPEIYLDILQVMSDRSLFKTRTGGPALKLEVYEEESEVQVEAEMPVVKTRRKKIKGLEPKVET